MFKFHIRGKPWLVSVDDYLYFDATPTPVFAKLVSSYQQAQLTDTVITATQEILWPALLEKAYAKVKGVYGHSGEPGAADLPRADQRTDTFELTGSDGTY